MSERDIELSGQTPSPDSMDIAADILSAVRYARPFFNQNTDLGKALGMVFDAATRHAGSFVPNYEEAAKWMQQRWESEAVQDGFAATPWDDLEPDDQAWWLTQATAAVDTALLLEVSP